MIFQEQMKENICKLMGGFAILVQITMACVAVLSLLLKRHLEYPKRPWIIWAMDTSKQAVAASLVHFTNVFVSMFSQLLGGGESSSNPCSWYFLNLLLDTTVGVYILYLFLTIANHFCARFLGVSDIESGEYGDPPRLYPWFKQLLIFLFSWIWVKLSIVFVLIMMPICNHFALWILSVFQENVDAQIFFVMFCFPLTMNIIQAILTDRIIKSKKSRQISADNSVSDDDEERAFLISGESSQSIQEMNDTAISSRSEINSSINNILQKMSRLFGGSKKSRLNVNDNTQPN